MAKILILSGYDDAMAPIGDRCTATHKAYAERHAYDHEVVRHYLPTSHPSHQKIRLLKERIHKYDGILWLDADTVVTDLGHWFEDIEVPTEHVMDISVDWCAPPQDDDADIITSTYVSCGNFILWNTPNTPRFLAEWEEASVPYATRNLCCWEQDGLRAAMRSIWFNCRVMRHHRRKFNAVHPTCVNRNFPDRAPKPWEPGDFLLHLTNVDRSAILDSLGL
jgi:hypothetical protein